MLVQEVRTEYGQSSAAYFAADRTAGGYFSAVHDCHRAELAVISTNPLENFTREQGDKAKLIFKLLCLRCTSYIGRTTQRKISGFIVGDELRGNHFREMFKDGDRSGLSVEAGAKGHTEIHSIDSELSSCWPG